MTSSPREGSPLSSRPIRSLLAGAALVAASLAFVPTATQADSDPVDPSDPATPTTVTADRLPTAQINGVVWSQGIAGDRVYAGGNFSSARPAGSAPGQNQVTRNNLLAYDLQTGQLISSFAPNFNGQITAVAVSPDESRVYVGGGFTQLNGQTQRRIATFNANTGALISTFKPPVYGSVDAIVATNTTVYAGGSFLGVGNQDRQNLAAFNASNGALLNWAPQATGGTVRALAMKPDGSRIVVGGSFTQLNGSSAPGYGLGMVDATTGANQPFAVNDIVRDATNDGAITTLSADEDYVYGGGYTFGKSGGTLEGVFAADWDGGDLHWINDCHGDSYSVHPQGDVIYQAGHFHYCENIDGFHQGDGGVGDYPYNRATAMSKAATGTATWEPDQGRYYSFEGQPTPSQLTWYPSLNAGQATGQNQGPWNVNGTDDYIVMGGEFTRVNGTSQQGLVRYGLKETAPNDRGPELAGASYPIKVASKTSGKVDITWGANHDQDNENLTYRVYRDTQNGAGLVHTRDLATPYWKLPVMGYTDTVAAGSSHQYRVSATDSSGNVANSPWVNVTAASSGSMSAYERAVRNSEPTHYWRLGEASGTVVGDTVGWGPQTARAGVTRNVAGAIAGDTDKAARFNGTSTGYSATNATADPPDVFTLEAWFKTTTSAGGKIVGWGNRNTRESRAKADRHIYMDNSGHINFGVKPNASRVSVASPQTYSDGQWHQATASLGPSGMKLYVDGEQVAQNAGVTVGEHLSRGYWSIGGDWLTSWPSKPTSDYFNGDIDEVAMYRSVLSPSVVANHYAAGTNGQPQNVPPEAKFTSTGNGLQVSVNGSTSTDSDGSIASYAWDFGDDGTATGVSPSHTYAAAGTYDVELTVTDDDGATNTLTKSVTVVAAPGNDPPTAAFTSSTDGLAASLNGSGSSDSDGSIASYAWDFGDGDTGTGATPSHTYDSADTYEVTLTVTDDDGATGTVSHQVTVEDGPGEPQQIAADTFQRSVTSGWGSANPGGSWTRTGSAGTYNVDGNVARMTTNGSGNGKAAYLGAVSSDDTDSVIDLTLNKAPAGGPVSLSYAGRRIDDNNKYNATVRYLADGTVNLSVRKIAGGTETNLDGAAISGLEPAANDELRVRLQVTGTSPTQVRAKIWEVGTTEPVGWQVSANDSQAALQNAGGVGVEMYVGNSVTNAPIVAGFDNLDVSGPGGDNPPAGLALRGATEVNRDVTISTDEIDGEVVVADPQNGTADADDLGITYQPDDRFAGTDTFAFTATDGGEAVTGSVVVRVSKAPSAIKNAAVKPRRLTPSKRGRLTADLKTPRTWPSGDIVVRAGKRVVGRGDPPKSGDVGLRLKKLSSGTHKIKIHYSGGPAATKATKTLKVRVRRG